jgi:hypothetical protein
MTVRNYFQLGKTEESLKSFKAIHYKPHENIPGEIRKDLMDNIVGVRGFNHRTDELVVKCHRSDQVGDFGNFDDLKQLIRHDGPLVYVDFDEETHEEVYINPGNVTPEAISTILSGHSAVILTPMMLIFKEEPYP